MKKKAFINFSIGFFALYMMFLSGLHFYMVCKPIEKGGELGIVILSYNTYGEMWPEFWLLLFIMIWSIVIGIYLLKRVRNDNI
jgi:hypothetical protein